MATGVMGAPGDPKNSSINPFLEISIGTEPFTVLAAESSEKESSTTTTRLCGSSEIIRNWILDTELLLVNGGWDPKRAARGAPPEANCYG